MIKVIGSLILLLVSLSCFANKGTEPCGVSMDCKCARSVSFEDCKAQGGGMQRKNHQTGQCECMFG